MKRNIFFVLCVLMLAAGLFVFFNINRAQGAVAVVDIANGKSFTISLAQDDIFYIDVTNGAKLDVTLEVKNEKIRFINSVCADHICGNFGWLSSEHDQAICLPAGVVVSVEK